MAGSRRTAVVGAGWAGLAAAVEAASLGEAVTVFEMAPTLGGRARSVELADCTIDNGQHIAIGAYRDTLFLMARLGVAERDAFARLPLALLDTEGLGLRLRDGPPGFAFARAVLANRRWPWAARFALLRMATRWLRNGFNCSTSLTVDALTNSLPAIVRDQLIDPLCVAALNTPASMASAQVFLRVLHDAIFSGPGASDLLLPRQPLGALLPEPAARFLRENGATLKLGARVDALKPDREGGGWCVDGAPFDRVILATSNTEAARLAAPFAAAWAACAAAFRHQAIVTIYLHSSGCVLPHPMVLLPSSAVEPAQFVFDRGQLGGPEGLLAFVVSGANDWIGRNVEIERLVSAQAARQLAAHLGSPLRGVQVITEKRATFACTPGLVRPHRNVAPNLIAAGDYIDGPYPATLEGAVRSGIAAARSGAARAAKS